MRQIPNALCNILFIKKGIALNKRIDLRLRDEFRDVQVVYGSDFGSCMVQIGGTTIFATCSCEITAPKLSRPSDGLIQMSLDLSSGCQEWNDSQNRQLPSEGISCIRLLERTIKDSHCIDTESLCLIKGEKVWQIKCDLTCLNYEGNLIEACSVAAIASLAHFKRPDVSVSSLGEIIIHSFEDKHPLSMTILHYPFCILYSFFKKFDNEFEYDIVCDPADYEETIADGEIVIGANSYSEIVTIHCNGKSKADYKTINYCSSIAVERAKKLTEIVKRTFESDKQSRMNKQEVGFAKAIELGELNSFKNAHLASLYMEKLNIVEDGEEVMIIDDRPTVNIYQYGRGLVGIGEGGPSTWQFEQIESDEDVDEEEDLVEIQTNKPIVIKDKQEMEVTLTLSDDEDDDEVTILD